MGYASVTAAHAQYLRQAPDVTRESRLFGAVEAGGTKFVCAIGDESGRLLAEWRFPTTDPVSTLTAVRDFFSEHRGSRAILKTGS